jgi:hypothetical protein
MAEIPHASPSLPGIDTSFFKDERFEIMVDAALRL